MEHRCIFSGFGGQGVISMGTLIAYAGMTDNKQVICFPTYGIAMRGGAAANCTVIVSDADIASPVVTAPNVAVAMNDVALDSLEPSVAPGGLVLVNSSLAGRQVARADVRSVYVPATAMAMEHGDGRMANMIMIGALLKATAIVPLEAVHQAMVKTFPEKPQALIGKNWDVMRVGYDRIAGVA